MRRAAAAPGVAAADGPGSSIGVAGSAAFGLGLGRGEKFASPSADVGLAARTGKQATFAYLAAELSELEILEQSVGTASPRSCRRCPCSPLKSRNPTPMTTCLRSPDAVPKPANLWQLGETACMRRRQGRYGLSTPDARSPGGRGHYRSTIQRTREWPCRRSRQGSTANSPSLRGKCQMATIGGFCRGRLAPWRRSAGMAPSSTSS